jgi:hypothetical protein
MRALQRHELHTRQKPTRLDTQQLSRRTLTSAAMWDAAINVNDARHASTCQRLPQATASPHNQAALLSNK